MNPDKALDVIYNNELPLRARRMRRTNKRLSSF